MFMILDACSTLGTCCTNYGLVSVISVLKNIMDTIQIVAPILLIISMTISFLRMVSNPELKNGMKKIFNEMFAVVLIFFIPVLVDVVLNMMPDQFEIASCFKKANEMQEVLQGKSLTYISIYDEKKKAVVNYEGYEKGDKKEEGSKRAKENQNNSSNTPNNNTNNNTSNNSPTNATSGNGSATGKQIVDYALQFVGQRYVYGGSWNGEKPYTPTDCSGFVGGVYKHFGYSMPRATGGMASYFPSHATRVSESNVQAGDIVLYSGHVALATGNGYQIVHASNSRDGIKISNDFRYRSRVGVYRLVK